MPLLLDCASFQIQYSSRVLGLLRGQLLADFFAIVRMNVIEETGAVPIVLAVIQDRRHRIGYVDNSSFIAGNNKQESIGCLENEVLQFLVGQKGWFVGAIVACISRA